MSITRKHVHNFVPVYFFISLRRSRYLVQQYLEYDMGHPDRLTDVGHNCKVPKVFALGLCVILRLHMVLTDSPHRCRNRRNVVSDRFGTVFAQFTAGLRVIMQNVHVIPGTRYNISSPTQYGYGIRYIRTRYLGISSCTINIHRGDYVMFRFTSPQTSNFQAGLQHIPAGNWYPTYRMICFRPYSGG